MHLRSILLIPAFVIALSAASDATAGDHTWNAAPRMRILSAGTTTVDQVVEITGTRINWGGGTFNFAFYELSGVIANETQSYWNGYQMALAVAGQITISYSSVCRNPLISAAAKATTSQSDTTDRWLASQEMYNSFILKGLWNVYRNNAPINIIINGQSYQGFSVTYRDGGQETWVVNPGAATSSVKLFDTPAPDSQKPPGSGPSC